MVFYANLVNYERCTFFWLNTQLSIFDWGEVYKHSVPSRQKPYSYCINRPKNTGVHDVMSSSFLYKTTSMDIISEAVEER